MHGLITCKLMDKGKGKRVNDSENASISATGSTNGRPNNRSNLRILLCDSNIESCREASTLLRQCSYQVTQVNTAAGMKDALLLEGPYTDIILSEANLLLSNGGELMKSITRNKNLQHIPVIMMLAENEMSLLKGLGLGAADYLVKPLAVDELLHLWTHIKARS